ncbi:Aquaporin-1 [Lachnellula suecica]|uniref:Aquaporin-1 n=1 Tax=Lachnellula suecica TaxID=602035 RepID=A0A8T9CE37_9HELO|nr:Aquaporin-1 [Lachnellula suecica]
MALQDSIRDHLVAVIGEFVGTFLFLFFAFASAQTANQPNAPGVLASGPDSARFLYISFAFSVSLAVNVWIFFRVSGGLFNPAVTLALCVVGIVPFVRAVFVTLAQISGGMAAAVAVRSIIPGDSVLFGVKLASGVTIAQGFFMEMFLTFELVITILMLAGEKTKATFLAPIAIGLALFIAHLAGVFWTGAGINPARAFGSSVAELSFPGYHWIYWFGPFAGALLAAALYKLLKILHYEEVNGDQDKSDDEQAVQPLLSRQTERIEMYLRMARPQSWRNSRREEEVWPLVSPRRARSPDAPQALRLYRLSGLDDYKSEASFNSRSSERRRNRSPSFRSRYEDPEMGYGR